MPQKRVVFFTNGNTISWVKVKEYIDGGVNAVYNMPYARAVARQRELSENGYKRTVISNKHVQYQKEV
jgi:hypothetical protein